MLLRLAFVAALVAPLLAFPRPHADDGIHGTIGQPTRLFLGLEIVPDSDHPFQRPGPGDQRGPCPGMNTLANHGYIPRNGIASVAEIVDGVQRGFNMDFRLGSAIAAWSMLIRGNVLLDKLSIGHESPMVPPLPGNIDGVPGGLAKHGRFEGDVSMTRRDAALGNSTAFQRDMYQELLNIQKEFHGDNPTVDIQVIARYKKFRYEDSLAKNPKFSFTATRFHTAFNEASFVINFFPSGDTNVLDVPTMGALFAGEVFPAKWFRRATPLDGAGVTETANQIAGLIPPMIGEKDKNGVFVPQVLDLGPCGTYNAFVSQVPAALVAPGVNPQIRANARQLLKMVKEEFGPDCPEARPAAPRETDHN